MEKRQGFPIVDIRSCIAGPIKADDIIRGLRSDPKHIPSLVLWDSRGLQLFTEITNTAGYYLSRDESRLLGRRADEIADCVKHGAKVIELGAGDMNKTELLLRAFERQQKNIHYMALDLDSVELEFSLARLARHLQPKFIECSGLLGTYDDCTKWLNRRKDTREGEVVFLWLGSSVCNLEAPEMSKLLSDLVQNGRKMFVGIDGCDDVKKLMKAYNTPCGLSSQFVMNGLMNANKIIGSQQFDIQDWRFKIRYKRTERTIKSSVVADRDMRLDLQGIQVQVRENEEVQMVESRKMSCDELRESCMLSKILLLKSWIDEDSDYSKWLNPVEIEEANMKSHISLIESA